MNDAFIVWLRGGHFDGPHVICGSQNEYTVVTWQCVRVLSEFDSKDLKP